MFNKGAIVRDFQNQVLQQEWYKFRTSVLDRRQERVMSLNEAQTALLHQRQTRLSALAQKQARLDQGINELNAKFTDTAIATEYDASRLVEKFEAPEKIATGNDAIDKDSKPLPCLGPRAHWIDCKKKYALDPRPCNAYVEALEKCVVNTISSKTTA